jgi:hypothetical protein
MLCDILGVTCPSVPENFAACFALFILVFGFGEGHLAHHSRESCAVGDDTIDVDFQNYSKIPLITPQNSTTIRSYYALHGRYAMSLLTPFGPLQDIPLDNIEQLKEILIRSDKSRMLEGLVIEAVFNEYLSKLIVQGIEVLPVSLVRTLTVKKSLKPSSSIHGGYGTTPKRDTRQRTCVAI